MKRRPNTLLPAAAALAAPLLVSGCKVGPNYLPPTAAVNEGWLSQAGEGEVNPRWWDTFNDPTLSSLVQMGYQQNLSLRAAGLRVLEARAARGIAVGQFFPQLQEVTGSVGAHQISANDALAAGDRSFATDSVGIQAAWELDFWGKFRRGIEAADAEVLLSVADYDAVLVSLIGDIATDYILICSLEERLVYARDNAKLQADTLSLTNTRFRAGAVSELDVSTARATLANTEALIPDLENSLRQTKLALSILLGRTPSDLDAELAPAMGGTIHLPEAPSQIATGIPAELLRRRPDVRAAERSAAAQSARIGQAVADLYPRISITGATGFVSSTFEGARTPNLGNIFDANSFAGFIGLQVNWPILNYGRITGNVRVQDARYEEAVAAYQETVLRAAGDVEGGLSDFLRSKERTTYLVEAVDASERSVELSLIQYRAGAVDFIRVNTAQTALVQQQDSLVVSRAAISLGAVRTYRALGGGWEIREGQEFIDKDTADRMRARTNWGDVLKPGWQDRTDLGFSRPADASTTGGDK
jgi:NodT family efflux transporter outer membrane factor (OMF) lipoprotein